MIKKVGLTGLFILGLSSMASANMFQTVIDFIAALIVTFRRVGGSLCFVMFIYGGARYIYSSDDPSGRKQAIAICVAAIVGGIIIAITPDILTNLASML